MKKRTQIVFVINGIIFVILVIGLFIFYKFGRSFLVERGVLHDYSISEVSIDMSPTIITEAPSLRQEILPLIQSTETYIQVSDQINDANYTHVGCFEAFAGTKPLSEYYRQSIFTGTIVPYEGDHTDFRIVLPDDGIAYDFSGNPHAGTAKTCVALPRNMKSRDLIFLYKTADDSIYASSRTEKIQFSD